MVTRNGQKLADVIKKAIEDHVVTNAEYEEIFTIALEDGMIDSVERALLAEFKEMLSDKTIKRVP